LSATHLFLPKRFTTRQPNPISPYTACTHTHVSFALHAISWRLSLSLARDILFHGKKVVRARLIYTKAACFYLLAAHHDEVQILLTRCQEPAETIKFLHLLLINCVQLALASAVTARVRVRASLLCAMRAVCRTELICDHSPNPHAGKTSGQLLSALSRFVRRLPVRNCKSRERILSLSTRNPRFIRQQRRKRSLFASSSTFLPSDPAQIAEWCRVDMSINISPSRTACFPTRVSHVHCKLLVF
jgi:hypothetical protein